VIDTVGEFERLDIRQEVGDRVHQLLRIFTSA
jgi:hypothetical protein